MIATIVFLFPFYECLWILSNWKVKYIADKRFWPGSRRVQALFPGS